MKKNYLPATATWIFIVSANSHVHGFHALLFMSSTKLEFSILSKSVIKRKKWTSSLTITYLFIEMLKTVRPTTKRNIDGLAGRHGDVNTSEQRKHGARVHYAVSGDIVKTPFTFLSTAVFITSCQRCPYTPQACWRFGDIIASTPQRSHTYTNYT